MTASPPVCFRGGRRRSMQLSVDKETEARIPAKTSLVNPTPSQDPMKEVTSRLSVLMAIALLGAANLFAQPRIVSKYGAARVQGRDVIVHVWVVVPPGLDENKVALEALRGQGARPFQSSEFRTTGLVWDQFFDGPGNDFVTQNNYNPAGDPTGGEAETALTNTHTTWTNVVTSTFAFESRAYRVWSKSTPIGSWAYNGRAMPIKTCAKSA